jgi:hypothetical protein
MALDGSFTIHGGSAGAVFHASGPLNFAPFSSFSSFLSDQFAFGASGSTEIDSASLTFSSPYGNFVFNNNDTISAAYGGDTVVSGSVSLDFVFGSATTSLLPSTPYSDTLTGASSFVAALEKELLKPSAPATVAAGASSIVPTVAAPTGTQISLGDAKATIVHLQKPVDKA